MNAGFRSPFFILGLAITLVPPIPPPVPVPVSLLISATPGPLEEEFYLHRLRRRFERQNRDDLEVVRLLTEFLSKL